MNVIRHRTPDKGWAWMISLSCAVINGLTFGLIRSFGVFFFYLRQEFDISRQVASWPFALCTSVTYLTGPITGLLISYFHLRTIVFFGIILTSFGFSACFWITDLSQIVILVGIVHGFGIGLSYMQTPVILAQYFVKYQATATAISYAGGTVGSFVFPALIEHIIMNYGLKGSFLIIGAVLLNGLPVALLLRPPIPDLKQQHQPQSFQQQQQQQEQHQLQQQQSINLMNNGISTQTQPQQLQQQQPQHSRILSLQSIRTIQHKLKRNRSKKWLLLRKSSIELYVERQQQRESQLTLNNSIRSIVMNEMASSSSLNDERKYNSNYNHQMLSRHDQPQTDLLSQLLRNENIKVHKKKARSMGQQFNETEMLVMESLHKTMESPMETNDEQHQQSFRTESINDSNNRKVIITKNKYCQTVPTAKRSQFVHSIVEIITNPMYIILLITHVSFQWAWMTYQMVIFDFGIDQDLTRSQSVSILIGFAVSDLFGRILSGWIADKQIIKKNHIVSICILCIGFFIQLTSMISSYRTHLSLTLLLDNLPVALGLSAFFVGATSLARPYVIGLFRDVIGSYNGLFRYVGTLSFIAALLWLMEPFAILNSKRRTNFKQTSSYI